MLAALWILADVKGPCNDAIVLHYAVFLAALSMLSMQVSASFFFSLFFFYGIIKFLLLFITR